MHVVHCKVMQGGRCAAAQRHACMYVLGECRGLQMHSLLFSKAHLPSACARRKAFIAGWSAMLEPHHSFVRSLIRCLSKAGARGHARLSCVASPVRRVAMSHSAAPRAASSATCTPTMHGAAARDPMSPRRQDGLLPLCCNPLRTHTHSPARIPSPASLPPLPPACCACLPASMPACSPRRARRCGSPAHTCRPPARAAPGTPTQPLGPTARAS